MNKKTNKKKNKQKKQFCVTGQGKSMTTLFHYQQIDKLKLVPLP